MASKKKTPPGKSKTDAEATLVKTGVYIFPDSSRYEGAFADGGSTIVRQGEGKHIAPNYIYTGNWEMDKMHGKGRLEFLDTGAVYEGLWKENRFMGQGSYKWSDGSILTAEWEGNRVNGPGKFQDSAGQSWIGLFNKGVGSTLSAEIE
ncbi:hypothetical protein HDU81_000005 [Chytriomyces hyalinus]|nr:hypothetical protein HDU81_000005 [Chytriomyces hyalinus]